MVFRLATVTAAAILVVCGVARGQVLMQRDVSVRMALFAIAQAALDECGVNTSVAVVDRASRSRFAPGR